ncbi:hypothetical protein TVAG_006060 [Trichomonas vaginalis G3]|uniref:Right handed beta helix domain-containing protein n=1 Tax=Trichomonas vaginalis (strain ATCC PRA-98 / G3) TaxID=412133 RepID=A2E713_TRIV3|nr:protein ubiquitination [Trichomonas vaginalis G3]EAY11531.1 hypothetical protein TVAG_006060 [Trichomonas vaginalis G3]KAI5489415.1 protein ubiquitination [Trichomonas vaginalis G3]|eukprot:XP_001323754.1 hypothetical protein [Trichomonas vaginalis G3]
MSAKQRRRSKSEDSESYAYEEESSDSTPPPSIEKPTKKQNAKDKETKSQEKTENKRYDPSQRQTLPPSDIIQFDLPQFKYPKLNDVIISPREGQKFVISKLIEDAKPGTTINIPSGTYSDVLYINKPLKILANGNVKLIGTSDKPAITVAADGVSFRGFEITQRKTEEDAEAAMLIKSGSVLLLDCSIKSDTCPSICVSKDSVANVNGCRFISKSAPNVLTLDNSCCTFELCNFQGSTANGLVFRDNSQTKLTRCTIQGFTKSGILSCGHSSFISEKCRITACSQNGVESCSDKTITLIDSSIEGCGMNGISLYGLASLRITGCTIEGCTLAGLEAREGSAARLSENVFSHCGNPSTLFAFEQATIDSHADKIVSTDILGICCADNSSVMMRSAVLQDIHGRGVLVSDNATLTLNDTRIERTDKTGVTVCHGGSLVLADSYVLNSCELGILVNDCHSAQLVNTHVDGSALSGLEINGVQTGFSIDQCNFTRCRQCGIVIIDSSVELSLCNAMSNRYSGFEVRSSKVSLKRCRADKNASGGICARGGSAMTVDTCSVMENGQVGASLENKSNITFKSTTIENNKHLGIAVELESFVTLKSCLVTKHSCVAMQVEGKDSRAFVDRTKFVSNDVAVLAVMNGRVAAKGATFDSNNMHIELRDKAKMKASGSEFISAAEKAGINICSNCVATFDDCTVSKNKNVGIACEGEIQMTMCRVNDNGLGAFLYGKSSGSITQTKFANNKKCAVYLQQGKVKITKNIIEGHELYGIKIEEKADADVDGNEFKRNSQDINRE